MSNEDHRQARYRNAFALDVADTLGDAAVALVGIAEALALRTAADPDDLLEMLADIAETQAHALRRMAKT